MGEPAPRESVERRAWTAEEDALLGTMTDQRLARRLGRGQGAVARRRRELGVPAYRARVPQVRREWAQGEDALLGTMTDKDLAERLGCRTQEVYSRRRRLGIPPFCHGRPPARS